MSLCPCWTQRMKISRSSELGDTLCLVRVVSPTSQAHRPVSIFWKWHICTRAFTAFPINHSGKCSIHPNMPSILIPLVPKAWNDQRHQIVVFVTWNQLLHMFDRWVCPRSTTLITTQNLGPQTWSNRGMVLRVYGKKFQAIRTAL